MAYGEHWEWRGFGNLSSAIRAQIEQLPLTYPAGGKKTVDQYLWVPGCEVNVKIRDQDLKFKYLLETQAGGFERWRELQTDQHGFPLKPEAVAKLQQGLGTVLPMDSAGEVKDLQALVAILPRCTPPVILVTIDKFRTTYTVEATGDKVLVELADIKNTSINDVTTAQALSTVNIECGDLTAGRRMHEALGLPGSLRVENYLQFVVALVQAGVLVQPTSQRVQP